MLKIANSYYIALTGENGNLAPFADECQRRENGSITADDHTQTPEEAAKDELLGSRELLKDPITMDHLICRQLIGD